MATKQINPTALKSCSQCGTGFTRPGVTCGRSQCQEAEYRATMERSRRPGRARKQGGGGR